MDIPKPGKGQVLVKHRYKVKYTLLNLPSEVSVYTKGNNPMWTVVDYDAETASIPKVNNPRDVQQVPTKAPEVPTDDERKDTDKPKRETVSTLIKKHGLKKSDIGGTGKDGKVTISDVRLHIKNLNTE